jgi:hypothetical protein
MINAEPEPPNRPWKETSINEYFGAFTHLDELVAYSFAYKIDAIQIFRLVTGLGLKEAKDIIEYLNKSKVLIRVEEVSEQSRREGQLREALEAQRAENSILYQKVEAARRLEAQTSRLKTIIRLLMEEDIEFSQY